jgi:hypothetical protein
MKSELYLPIAILLNAIVAFGQGADTAGSKSFARDAPAATEPTRAAQVSNPEHPR